MGRSPDSSVLNANNQVHEIPNLFVTDGAAMSSSATQGASSPPGPTAMVSLRRASAAAAVRAAAPRLARSCSPSRSKAWKSRRSRPMCPWEAWVPAAARPARSPSPTPARSRPPISCPTASSHRAWAAAAGGEARARRARARRRARGGGAGGAGAGDLPAGDAPRGPSTPLRRGDGALSAHERQFRSLAGARGTPRRAETALCRPVARWFETLSRFAGRLAKFLTIPDSPA